MQQPGLTANLDSFDLLDLVQVIQMDRHDLSLVVRDGPQRLGVLRFSQGELLWAEYGEMRGDQAFMALAAQRAGSIEQLPWDGQGECNVSQPLARLILQAVTYRDGQSEWHRQWRVDEERRQQPVQVPLATQPSTVSHHQHHTPGTEHHLSGNGPIPAARVMLPNDDSVPGWLREMQSIPPTVAPAHEQEDVSLPQPTLPLSALNGKFTLPSLSNGSRAAQQFVSEEPPTAPLPTVQGEGLLSSASRSPSQPPLPTIPTLPAAQTDSAANLSGLSILEQLAYGGLASNGLPQQNRSRMDASAVPLVTVPALAPPPVADSAGVAMSSSRSPGASALTGKSQQVDQALERFAEQMGPACIATAIVRTDGSVVAEYNGRRSEAQELVSPAYHLAHVMQSSLRALLMGGWGDLEDTMITGSSHLIVLRRLGRAEKGLFHVAVLERSGNPGLCRVRMRNSEPALLQIL